LPLLKTFVALNALLCADAPLRNYPLTHGMRIVDLTNLVLAEIFHVPLFLLISKFSPHPPDSCSNLTDGKSWIGSLHLLPYLQ